MLYNSGAEITLKRFIFDEETFPNDLIKVSLNYITHRLKKILKNNTLF